MPELQAVAEGTGEEAERPLVETIDTLLGRRLRVRPASCLQHTHRR